jgi:hypothetical protein
VNLCIGFAFFPTTSIKGAYLAVKLLKLPPEICPTSKSLKYEIKDIHKNCGYL